MNSSWLINSLKDIWSHSKTIPTGERLLYVGTLRYKGKTYTRLLNTFRIEPNMSKHRFYLNEAPMDIIDDLCYLNGMQVRSEVSKMERSPLLIYKMDEDLAHIGMHLRSVGVPDEDMVRYLPHKMHARALQARKEYSSYFSRFKFSKSYPGDWVGNVSRPLTIEEAENYVYNFMLHPTTNTDDNYFWGTENEVGSSIYLEHAKLETEAKNRLEAEKQKAIEDKGKEPEDIDVDNTSIVVSGNADESPFTYVVKENPFFKNMNLIN